MVNITKGECLNLGFSRFKNSGISTETLIRAAETAAKLCKQTEKAHGSAVAPCHFADYQRLFLELAAKKCHDDTV